MGLEWKDVNFDAGTLEVQRASHLPERGTFTKSPKNESSVRLLSVPMFLADTLKRLKREQAAARLKVGDLWQGSDRIFTTWDGKPMHPDTPTSWFPKFLKKHGLPHLSFHGLRHSSATLLINQGAKKYFRQTWARKQRHHSGYLQPLPAKRGQGHSRQA